MIKRYEGFAPEQSASGPREKLPAGGYVAKILNAEIVEYSWGSVLVLAHDITEGEYTGFWKDDYDTNEREDRKWRGNIRITLPKGDGSDKDEWAKRAFNNLVWAAEYCNPGYKWNWDEKTLVGKEIGVLYRNKEWAMNGQTGWTTEACSVVSSESIRDNTFRVPKDKPLANKPVVPAAPTFTVLDDDGELPF